MTKEIKTKIVIQASPEKIWTILTDFDNYPNWNPFIVSVDGIAKEGNNVTVNIVPLGGKGMTFKPIIRSRIENRKLVWEGHLFIKGLFDGTHQFELIEHGDGSTTFLQNEIFSGLLVRFFNIEHTKAGFEKMNTKLKELAEKDNGALAR